MIQQNDTATVLNQAESPILLAQGSSVGSWQLLSYNCPFNPIHAALLRTGRVLFVSGSGNEPNKVDQPDGNAVWNVNNGTFFSPEYPYDDAAGLPLDLFCGGHSFLPDGRLMFASGTLQYDPFYGLPVYLIFDPITEQWSNPPGTMAAGRWYPTLVTLGDGRVLAVSGLETSGLLEDYPSIWSPQNDWVYYSQPTSPLPMYAHLFLLSSGKIFFAGGCFANTGVSPRILTLPTDFSQQIPETPLVSGLQDAEYVEQAASVLLPPAQDQKVMIIGGGNGFQGETTKRVNIVDLRANNPTYTAGPSLKYARMHHNAVLLPDRTVFVCNGSAKGEDGNRATPIAEIYDPSTNSWTDAATANVTGRLYHALALLLPDGRVATAGGNPDRGVEELRMEIYSPWYMSQSRPVINNAPETITYGQQFQIGVSTGNILWVSLIRPMATTHGLDTEQRVVNLPINSVNGNTLTVTVTSNPNLAPPGWYMLFINNQSKVPSVAKWIQLG